jgi:hypothetical protein
MRPALTLAAVAIATCGAIGAPAGMAWAELSALDTIALWEGQGYYVNVDRVGSAPLSECIVTSVRNPQTVTKLVRVDRGRRHNGGDGGGGGNGDRNFDWVEVIASRSISVSLDCSR